MAGLTAVLAATLLTITLIAAGVLLFLLAVLAEISALLAPLLPATLLAAGVLLFLLAFLA